LYQLHNSCSKVSWSVLAKRKPIESNSWPAAVSGRSVNFLFTVCIWWNWQICTGMSQNTLGMPVLPSKTAAVSRNPFLLIWLLRSEYASLVSFRIQAQPRLDLRCGDRATSNVSSPRCVASKTQITSWGVMVLTAWSGTRSIILRIVFSPLW